MYNEFHFSISVMLFLVITGNSITPNVGDSGAAFFQCLVPKTHVFPFNMNMVMLFLAMGNLITQCMFVSDIHN